MAQSRFVDASEYQVILQRVNQVICQFSNSTDKTGDAIVFMTRIEEKCTTREEFLTVIEKRLDLLSNPSKSQEYVDWFKSRRDNLVGLLKGIKEKVANDSTYLTKFSPSFAKGMQCLDRLLKTDVHTIGHNHMVDLTRVRKAVLELKGEIDNKAKAQEKPPADPTVLYVTLLEVINSFNVLNLEPSVDRRGVLFDLINTHKNTLETHATTYSDTLDAATLHRIHTAVQLLGDLHRHSAPPAVVAEETEDTEDTEAAPATPPLPLTVLYAVLSDLKTAEWRYLQTSLDSTATTDQELLQQLHKRRKASVAITTTPNTPITPDNTSTTSSATNALTLSLADQKFFDSLQGHQNSLETGTHRERIEHFLDQMYRNEGAFELFDWDSILDAYTHTGAALLKE